MDQRGASRILLIRRRGGRLDSKTAPALPARYPALPRIKLAGAVKTVLSACDSDSALSLCYLCPRLPASVSIASPCSRPSLSFPRWHLPAQKKNLPLPHLPLTMPLPRTRPKTARSRESQSPFSDISPCSFYIPLSVLLLPALLLVIFLCHFLYLNPVPRTHIRNLVPNFHVFTFHSLS